MDVTNVVQKTPVFVYVFFISKQIKSLLQCVQGFDSASTDTGTGQDGDKEDGDDTEEKDENQPEDRLEKKLTVQVHFYTLSFY